VGKVNDVNLEEYLVLLSSSRSIQKVSGTKEFQETEAKGVSSERGVIVEGKTNVYDVRQLGERTTEYINGKKEIWSDLVFENGIDDFMNGVYNNIIVGANGTGISTLLKMFFYELLTT